MSLLGTSVAEVAGDVLAGWDDRHATRLAYLRTLGAHSQRCDSQPDRAPDVLDEIPPADYVEALTRVEVPHHGFINCPLPGHEDRTPSFKVYDTPSAGWYCFGCARGGDIFTLAAELWGIRPT